MIMTVSDTVMELMQREADEGVSAPQETNRGEEQQAVLVLRPPHNYTSSARFLKISNVGSQMWPKINQIVWMLMCPDRFT